MLKHFICNVILVTISLTATSHAQTCAEPKASDFKLVTLPSDGLDHPVHLSVVSDGRIFIAEMGTGTIKVYKPSTNTIGELGNIAVRSTSETGLLGIATPPDFATSHFLYAYYTDPSNSAKADVLARYIVNGDALVPSSRTELLRIPLTNGGFFHSAGGMVFNAQGDLYLSTGDDTDPRLEPNDGFGALDTLDASKDAQRSTSNSNDWRGKILRIHPVPTAVGGLNYTIPAGNFKDIYASMYTAGDLAKIKPEIYTMGVRNPFRFTVDDKTGWLIWAEVGPDADNDVADRGKMGYDELNVARKPGFYGWPYCNGNQFAYNRVNYSTGKPVPGEKYDCANPENVSPNNSGVKKLPASQAPVVWYATNDHTSFQWMGAGYETFMGGPFYRYDKSLVSTVKFPPQYDGRMYVWDWNRQVHRLVTFDSSGALSNHYEFPITTLRSIISSQYGPDGALYLLQYSYQGYSDNTPGLFRVEYKGAIDNACAPVTAVHSQQILKPEGNLQLITGQHFVTLPVNSIGFELFGTDGKKVWSYTRKNGDDQLRIELPSSLITAISYLRFHN